MQDFVKSVKVVLTTETDTKPLENDRSLAIAERVDQTVHRISALKEFLTNEGFGSFEIIDRPLEHFCEHGLLYDHAVKVKRERKMLYHATGLTYCIMPKIFSKFKSFVL